MFKTSPARLMVVAVGLTLALARPASAQITTGTVTGTVADAQGVVPGATVVMVSETKGTKSAPQVTDGNGNYTFAYVAADVYTVSVEMNGYKTSDRQGVRVSGGDKIAVPTMTLVPGGITDTVDVKADVAILQAASGERSDVVQSAQLESLPVANRGFRDLVNLLPGVSPSGGGRIGGGGQDNIMIDGISIMDTGNNGLMGGTFGSLNIPVDQVSEVRLETSGYQAEFGRSSGLQVSAVTKSGTNRFHGSGYEISNNSKWNQNSWANIQNGVAKSRSKSNSYGFTIGGPVGKPGGNNKLFFFFAEQFNPTLGGNSTTQMRVPTPEERQGIFTYSLDQQGKSFLTNGNGLYNAGTGLAKSACSATNGAACFANGVIPVGQLYGPTVALLNLYPLPNCSMGEPSGAALSPCPSGQNFNYTTVTPVLHNLNYVPTFRGDYQVTPGLRVSGKVTLNSARVVPNPGSLPGITDTISKFNAVWDVSGTVNYSLSPTMFLEATYGFNQNRLGTPPTAPASSRNNVTCANDIAAGTWGGLNAAAIPNCTLGALAFPLKGGPGQAPITMDQRYYEFRANNEIGVPWLDPSTGVMSMQPVIQYNAASGTTGRYSNTVPSLNFPGFMNINHNQNFSASVTKVMGRHTAKAGLYIDHSYKAQNTGAGGGAPSFQGTLNFGNDSNNPLTTGFPLADEALGIYQTFGQASNFVEGSFVYTSIEPYIQDNWKVTRKLTLDYGLRFVHQAPQYDQFGQVANFFPNQWSLAAAPKLYQPGCAVALTSTGCPSVSRQALDPTTGKLLGAGTAGLIGAAVPNSGNFANGIIQADGKSGIPITGYLWPGLVFGPRFGGAYDLTGNQKIVLRGNIGLFYDRPNGNTVFSTVSNPPLASSLTNQWAQLGSNSSLSSGPVSTLTVFQYNAKQPSDTQWSGGVQIALPWSSSVGLAYVGHHSFNTLSNVNLNAIDLCTTLSVAQGCGQSGSAFANTGQDPTQAPGTAKVDNLLRPLQGYAAINNNETIIWRTFHSIQTDYTRRFRDGVSFGVAWTISLSDKSNNDAVTGNPLLRLVHNADGTFSTAPTQAQAQALFADQGPTRHIVQTNFVWALPHLKMDNSVGRVLGAIVNDWQLSGILRVDSGGPYDLSTPTYASGGGNNNLTGSSDYGARILVNNVGALGAGCSSNQYAQFANNFGSTNFVLSPATTISGPVVGSLGLESGRNLLHACANRTLDLSLARTIRLGGGRQLQLRADAFNAPNAVIFNNRNTTVNLTSPTNQTVTNSQILADGTVDTTKLKPNQAGFGAVSNAMNPRTVQLQIRFLF